MSNTIKNSYYMPLKALRALKVVFLNNFFCHNASGMILALSLSLSLSLSGK
jgi:glucan phosphorylase